MNKKSLPFITHIIRFGRKLHDAGIDVNPSNLIDLSRCLLYIDIAKRRDFYAAALATLIIKQEDMQLFTLLFNEYWDNLETVREDEYTETKTGDSATQSEIIRRQLQSTNPMMERKKARSLSRPVIPARNCWRRKT